MKRKKQKTKQADDIKKWLNAIDEMLDAMIATAGWDWENRRALGEIFVNTSTLTGFDPSLLA